MTTVNYYESDNQAFLDEFTTISADEFVLSPDNTWYSEGITTEEIAALVEDEEAFDIYYDRVYCIGIYNYVDGATLIGDYVPSYTRNTPDFDLPPFRGNIITYHLKFYNYYLLYTLLLPVFFWNNFLMNYYT